MKSFSSTPRAPKNLRFELLKASGALGGFESLAIGKFDGMHRAHRALLKELDSKGALLCVRALESKARELTPLSDIGAYSPYPIIALELEMVRDMDAREFVSWLRAEFASVRRLVVGYDFRFGRGRSAGVSELKKLFDGEVVILPEYCLPSGVGVHSRLIKAALARGDMALCSEALGRHYHIRGRVVRGQGIGAKQLYATINLECESYVLPQNGVYASFVRARGAEGEGIYPSVSFVGTRLSTDGGFSIESHILDSHFECKGEEARVCFVRKIRDNARFDNLSKLKARISKDIAQSRQILNNTDMGDVKF